MEKFVKFEVYKAPASPSEYGEYYGSTSIFEQAQVVVKHLFENGGSGGFIKGVRADGSRCYIWD